MEDALKKGRDSLYRECLDKEPDLSMGLHSIAQRSIFDIRIEKYRLSWLDHHWNWIDDLVGKYKELTVDERRGIFNYFCECYAKLIRKYENHEVPANTMFFEMLRIKKRALDEMINVSYMWDKNHKQLCVEYLKHEEEYKKLLKEYGEDI